MSVQDVRVEIGPRSYAIAIGPGLIDEAGRRIAAALPGARPALVTDENVAAHHLPRLDAALRSAGLEPVTIVVPPGERSKSFPVLQRLTEDLLATRLERSDAVLAFGGGVVGDLAGFAAAITRRGMPLVQMPTTLLAQVDSSVGGKTGINSALGKNLVGAFHQPRLVLADTGVLETLPRREFAAGYAEIAKYGLIDDAGFFAWLEDSHKAIFAGGPERQQAIAHSCRAKARIVARDEEEAGERALLNLGHTFGHALEAFCGYDPARLIHGEAVAIGLALAHDFSAAEGLAPAADAERVRRHLEDVGLPSHISAIGGDKPSADALMSHIAQDKKVRRGQLTFILSRGIGQAFIAADISPGRVHAFLQQQLSE